MMKLLLCLVAALELCVAQKRFSWQDACFKNPTAAFCKEREWAVKPTPPAPREQAPRNSITNLTFTTGTRATAAPTVTVNQGSLMAAPPAMPIVKVPDDRITGIAVGTERQDVLQKLGEPHSKISGDFERYTYQLESGKTLKLDLEDGRVTQVRSIDK